jgi:Uma2 family endonuclease
MSILTTTPWTSWQVPTLPVRPFTVDEYHRLVQIGMLAEDEPVELLEGWITPKMPRSPLHDSTVDLLADLIRPLLPPGWRVRTELAVTTSDSEPIPDLAVTLGPATRYRQTHPLPADVEVLIEVADSSLSRDRNEKARLYARASIATYWIVNLQDVQIEVYTDPTGPDASAHYRRRQDFRSGDSVPLVIGGQQVGAIAVADLLPAQR